MIDGLKDVKTSRPLGQFAAEVTEDHVENIALAGAAAIQRIIADRDQLRVLAKVQQQDLVALSALNKELCGRIALIRHHYVELGTQILAQLEQFDRATRNAMQDEHMASDAAPNDEANLVAIANRFKPSNPSSNANGRKTAG
jgi:hypothetical protein